LCKLEDKWPVLIHYNGGSYTKGYFLLLPKARRLFVKYKQLTPWADAPDYLVRGIKGRLKIAVMYLLYFTPLKRCYTGFFKLYAKVSHHFHSFTSVP